MTSEASARSAGTTGPTVSPDRGRRVWVGSGCRRQLVCGITLLLAAACTGGSGSDSSVTSTAMSVEVNGVAHVLPAGEQHELWIDLFFPMMRIRECGTELEKVLAAPDPPPRYLLLQVRRCARKLEHAIEFIRDGADGADGAHEAVSAVMQAVGDVCGRVGDLAAGESLPTALRADVNGAVAAATALTRWYEGLRGESTTTQPA